MMERTFRAEGAASAKSLRQERIQLSEEQARRPTKLKGGKREECYKVRITIHILWSEEMAQVNPAYHQRD